MANTHKFLKFIMKVFCMECLISIAFLLSIILFSILLTILNINDPIYDALAWSYIIGFIVLFNIISVTTIPAFISILIYFVKNGKNSTYNDFKNIFTNYQQTTANLLKYCYITFIWCGYFTIFANIIIIIFGDVNNLRSDFWSLGINTVTFFIGYIFAIPLTILFVITGLFYIKFKGGSQTLSDLKKFIRREQQKKFALKIIGITIFFLCVIIFLIMFCNDVLTI